MKIILNLQQLLFLDVLVGELVSPLYMELLLQSGNSFKLIQIFAYSTVHIRTVSSLKQTS